MFKFSVACAVPLLGVVYDVTRDGGDFISGLTGSFAVKGVRDQSVNMLSKKKVT